MKKIILPFVILIITILSVNCSSDKNANTDIKILKLPESGEETLKASYIADTLIYIPLETTKESLMDQDIRQIWLDNYYILINCKNTGLLLFRQDGKFLKKIGKQGRGPGEYGTILHFDVILDTIYISSTSRRGFLRYTFDGNFCDEIKLNYQPVFFSTTVDQKLACYCIEEGKIYVYNNLHNPPNTIVVEYGVTKGRYKWSLRDTHMTFLQKYSKGLLFYDYKSDTVWNITENKKELAFIVDLKNKLPFDKQIEFCNGDLQGWNKMVTSYQQVHIFPLPSYTFIFQKHWRGAWYDAIYLFNTKTMETKKFNKFWISDDIVSGDRISPINFAYSKDCLVAFGYPPSEKDLEENKANAKQARSQLWLNQMKTVKEGDNPILVKLILK